MSRLEVDIGLERVTRPGDRFRLDATFQVDSGITVLFGPSGAGKSTLLLAVLGALRPDRGRIALADRVLYDRARGIDRPVRERRIGIVFQDALLFPHLDGRGNVAFGIRDASHHHADELLARVGADALARRRPGDMSGGERQRVALARALAARPDALLLDEPFSALDAPARHSLCQLVATLQAETAIPFLHVTHDPAEALRLGTTMVVLERGRVTRVDPPQRVLGDGRATQDGDNLFLGEILEQRPQDGYTRVDLGGTRVDTAPLEGSKGDRVVLRLSPQDILVATAAVHNTSARNVIPGTIRELQQDASGVELRVATPVEVRVRLTRTAVDELGLKPEREVVLLVKAHSFRRA